jgi:hypothetical protein
MNRIDHIVVNTRDRTDQAVAWFERAGFIVTPRGHHTLGSLNHTIVFRSDYLELLGYPPGKPPEKRPELVQRPAGLMATVLDAGDADQVRATLQARGLAPRPVSDFSRPVEIGGGKTADVGFRVTRLEPDTIPGSWFYYCQHLTPELVWRAEWQGHANACVGMLRLDIAVDDTAAAAALYLRAMDGATAAAAGTDAMRVTLPNFEFTLHAAAGGLPGMRTLAFGSADMARTAEALTRGGIIFRQHDKRITIDANDEIGCGLEFVPVAQSSL